MRVVVHEGANVWVIYNGNFIKLAECRVQPVHAKADLDRLEPAKVTESNKVSFQITDDNDKVSEYECLENGEVMKITRDLYEYVRFTRNSDSNYIYIS